VAKIVLTGRSIAFFRVSTRLFFILSKSCWRLYVWLFSWNQHCRFWGG